MRLDRGRARHPSAAHAGPASSSPIADTASAPSRRNFLMHHPPHVAFHGLVLAPLLRLEAAKVSGYLQADPLARARPARCSVCGRSARNRSVYATPHRLRFVARRRALYWRPPACPRRQLLSFSSARQPTNRLSSDGRPAVYAVTQTATGSNISPCSRVQLGQQRASRPGLTQRGDTGGRHDRSHSSASLPCSARGKQQQGLLSPKLIRRCRAKPQAEGTEASPRGGERAIAGTRFRVQHV